MKDFIFVTGASGIGKTTLANGLLEHYKTTCIEQHMVPEFISRDGSEPMTGELEERTCWENQVAMLMCFHRLGEVLEQSINIIETTPSCFDYEYAKPPKEMFYSWVFANGLR